MPCNPWSGRSSARPTHSSRRLRRIRERVYEKLTAVRDPRELRQSFDRLMRALSWEPPEGLVGSSNLTPEEQQAEAAYHQPCTVCGVERGRHDTAGGDHPWQPFGSGSLSCG